MIQHVIEKTTTTIIKSEKEQELRQREKAQCTDRTIGSVTAGGEVQAEGVSAEGAERL